MLVDKNRIQQTLAEYCDGSLEKDVDFVVYLIEEEMKLLVNSWPKEICICAAVVAENGQVFRGHRHGDCLWTMDRAGLKCMTGVDSQGFITSRNRYVTREEGRKLQDAANIPSADPEGYRGKTLFSEDLY